MPIIALVGRPNVGKSTLFNTLTKSRDSLVADQPGVTRDRQYGVGKVGEMPYWLIDTGGMLREEQSIDVDVDAQARLAVAECDVVFFLVDAKDGVLPADEDILHFLRRSKKPFVLVVNKTDFTDTDVATADFYRLGVGDTFPISATHNRGIQALMSFGLKDFDAPVDDETFDEDFDVTTLPINLTVIGRPNAGKSTLINRLLGENRVIASDVAGTTRDSIEIPFEYADQAYILVDTAGIRRKSKVKEHVEKISVIKTLQAIEKSNVVLLLLDAHEGIGDLDAHLLGAAIDAGKGLVIAVNKWDHLDEYNRTLVKNSLSKKLSFIDFARIHFISALHGTGIRDVLKSAQEAHRACFVTFSTNKLTDVIKQIAFKHQAPLINGYSVKIRYAHQGGKNPPLIVIHGSRVSKLPSTYVKYLEKNVREHFKLFGTPIKFRLKDTDNPFEKNSAKR